MTSPLFRHEPRTRTEDEDKPLDLSVAEMDHYGKEYQKVIAKWRADPNLSYPPEFTKWVRQKRAEDKL